MPEIRFSSGKDKLEKLPEDFEPYVKKWFNSHFKELSEPQKYSFKLIHERKNTLICAPTGSGKTLSAFLSMLNELFLLGDRRKLEDKIYVLYISPLKALNNDIDRNLSFPLEEIRKIAKKMGIEMPEIRSAVRTGDTSQNEKSKQLRKPPHILITTPESLAIILSAPKFKENLLNLKYVIVDEIHALCENKRGVHLSLSLERLQQYLKENGQGEFTRIGISATQSPIEEIAKFLVGFENRETRGCTIIDSISTKKMDFKVLSPVRDIIHTPSMEITDEMYNLIHSLVQKHKTTLIFTNTRAATERVVHTLKTRYPKFYNENIGTHHSSMSRELRLEVEEKLKNGELKVVVTSTSLELGIDIGYIDLVIQLSSPKGIARAIQRIGRSGHQLHEKSKGRIIVLDREDALECTLLLKCALDGKLDRMRIPKNCLDVLSQHIVGMSVDRTWNIGEAFKVIRQSYCYFNLSEENYRKVLDYLGGKYVSLEEQKVYSKIWLDEEENKFGKRGKAARMIYMTNLGTIPDESSYKVYIRNTQNKVGNLDEEYLDRLTKGDVFTLGGKTYKFNYARGMKVYVEAKPDLRPNIPAWFSEMLPLSFDLGIEIGKFNEKMFQQLSIGVRKEDIVQWLLDNYPVDENAANSIYNYLFEQYRYIGIIPTDKKILVERTRDEKYAVSLIFHTIYGRRVNDVLSRAISYEVSKILDRNLVIQISDHGFVLSGLIPKDADVLLEKVKEMDLEKNLKEAVRKTDIMKRRFRHVATRSFMILRSYRGRQKTVGRQQLNAHFLMHAVEKIDPDFPVLLETYREIMEDAMDINNAKAILEGLKKGEIEFVFKETEIASPFAHNLILVGKSDVMIMEDRKKMIQRLHKEIMLRIGEEVEVR